MRRFRKFLAMVHDLSHATLHNMRVGVTAIPLLNVDEACIVLVRLKASSSPATFEDAIRRAAPALVGSLLSWAGGDRFAVAQDAIPVLDRSDGVAMVDAVKVVDAAEFAAIASLRVSRAGASSFGLPLVR